MGINSRETLVSALKTNLVAYAGAQMDTYARAVSMDLFDELTGNLNVALLGRIGGFGEFPDKPEGLAPVAVAAVEGAEATITPKSKSLVATFTREAVEDTMGAGHDVRKAADDFAKGYMATRDRQCADVLNSSTAGYDGKALFAADHPRRSNGGSTETFSNISGTLGNVSDTTLRAALTLLQDTNAFNEDGQSIEIMATHLVCTTQDQFYNAVSVLKSNGQADTANNNANPLYTALVPVLWRRAKAPSGAAQWFVAAAKKGLVYYLREGFSIEADYDKFERNYKASPYFRGAAGYADWRGIVKVTES